MLKIIIIIITSTTDGKINPFPDQPKIIDQRFHGKKNNNIELLIRERDIKFKHLSYSQSNSKYSK